MGARAYAPSAGAWTSMDTVAGSAADPAGMNRFLYVEGNPSSLIDPDGHMARDGQVCDRRYDDCEGTHAGGTAGAQTGMTSTGHGAGTPKAKNPYANLHATAPKPTEAPALKPPNTLSVEGFPVVPNTTANKYYMVCMTSEFAAVGLNCWDLSVAATGDYPDKAFVTWHIGEATAFVGLTLLGPEVAGSVLNRGVTAFRGWRAAGSGAVTEAEAAALALEDAGMSAAEANGYLRSVETGDTVAGTVGSSATEGVTSGSRWMRGTNKPGQVTSRPTGFRSQTDWDAWNDAAPGPNGGRLCPSCGQEVVVPPGQSRLPIGVRQASDWHRSHNPSFTNRLYPPNSTRGDILDDYNRGVFLECPVCNIRGGNNDARFGSG